MKNIMIAACLLTAACCQAQPAAPVYARNAYLDPRPLAIGFQKTTSLIFPSAIKTVDRGSADILVQKTEGVENVLKLKAARHRFEETNLSVITADGQFYAFNVSYQAAPASFTVLVGASTKVVAGTAGDARPVKAIFSDHMTNETRLRKLAAQASITRRNIRNVQDEQMGITAALTGLYIADDKFFYKIMVTNSTNISYEMEALNFYIRDRKKVRRMATQEIALEPVMTIGDKEAVAAHASRMLIIVMPKQTIAQGKRLVIEMEEAKGGRNTTCTLKNSVLLKAEPIRITDAVDQIPNVLSAGR